MIPRECRRLAEVDFPIARVSEYSMQENRIRQGHPKTVHLWWARRPLSACRSMLLALLLPDPCDAECPEDFKSRARDLFSKVMLAGRRPTTDADLRARLLQFIGDFSDWNNANSTVHLEVARGLVTAAYPEETPLVLDSFAGSGSIPLEAVRLQCESFASDLNPVACLINRVLLEDLPRHKVDLVERLLDAGNEVAAKVEAQLSEYYPRDPDGAQPITYLWARTVRCESPNCGAEIPLLRSFWLCKKAARRRALLAEVVRPKRGEPRVEFNIFTPSNAREVRSGTVSQAKATCLCCNTALPPERVRAQLAEQRGGSDARFDATGARTGGARLLAVVTLREDARGRQYRLPTNADYAAVRKAQQHLEATIESDCGAVLSRIPDEDIPKTELRRISLPIYGMEKFSDLFTARQLVAMSWFCESVEAYASSCPPINHLLTLCVGKLADLANALCSWEPLAECPRHTLTRHDIPMAWDFAEGVSSGESSGSFATIVDNMSKAIEASLVPGGQPASVETADACNHPLPNDSAAIWFTDPPYYDAIPYAHLSDFFHVWQRRALGVASIPQLTPKSEECVVDRPHRLMPNAKTRGHFESRVGLAMGEGVRVIREDGVACVVFAHKTTEGWEALLGAMISAGWVITASWPIITEMQSRLNARDNSSLASSVHLVCRPRSADAPIGDWGRVLRELPQRVGNWMERLQSEGIRGADLVFACIGPALEVFSQYSKVVDAEEREIPLGGDPESREPHLRGFLAYVWEVVGRTALEQVLGTAEAKARNGGAGALEEDARLTALFLWTVQTTTEDVAGKVEPNDDEAEGPDDDRGEGEDEEASLTRKKKKKGLSLPFDVVRRFAQPLGIHLDAWEDRCIATAKGIVRLVPVLDRAEQLFGEDGADVVAARLEQHRSGPVQATLFPVEEEQPATPVRGRRRRGRANVSDETIQRRGGGTTLDHVHAAMLLQSSGRANALRALLKSEIERGPDFLRLANALSALYPKESDEKRLLDAMLLAVPR